jgi:hypothetical protein
MRDDRERESRTQTSLEPGIGGKRDDGYNTQAALEINDSRAQTYGLVLDSTSRIWLSILTNMADCNVTN